MKQRWAAISQGDAALLTRKGALFKLNLGDVLAWDHD
jgi:hypothetical protein